MQTVAKREKQILKGDPRMVGVGLDELRRFLRFSFPKWFCDSKAAGDSLWLCILVTGKGDFERRWLGRDHE